MAYVSISPPHNQHGRDNILRLCKSHVDRMTDVSVSLENGITLMMTDFSMMAAGLIHMNHAMLTNELLYKQRVLELLVEERHDDEGQRIADLAEFILNTPADYAREINGSVLCSTDAAEHV